MRNKSLDKLLGIFGGFILIISFIILYGTYEKMKITERGEIITVSIREAPKDCSKIDSNTGYCKLEYKGKVYTTRAGKKFCHLVSGKNEIDVLTNQSKDKFLFIDEYDSSQYANGIIMVFISLIIIYKGFKGKKND